VIRPKAPMKNKKFIVLLVLLACVLGLGFWFDQQHSTAVVMYHNIAANPQNYNDTVSPQTFQAQLEYFKAQGYHVLRFSDLVGMMKAGKKLPRKTLVLTFDDGYENNFLQAFPLLKQYGLTATFFISAGKVGQPGFMNWKELSALQQGGMDIGAHGMGHVYLPQVPDVVQNYEITESKKQIEARLKNRVDIFSYPVGGFNENIKRLVMQAGYQGAATTNRGAHFRNDDIYAIRRIKLTDKDVSAFNLWRKCSGYYYLFQKPKKPH